MNILRSRGTRASGPAVCVLPMIVQFLFQGYPAKDNLVDPRSGKARPGLELVVHYRGVNEDIWRYWAQRYLCGANSENHEQTVFYQMM